MKRSIITVLAATIAFAYSGNGPSFGKWQFAGKDNTGVAWIGTLTIGKLDTQRFSSDKYYSACVLEVKSKSMERTVDTPCMYDSAARAVSFATGLRRSRTSYDAVLSPDGKSLVQGKWSELEQGAVKETGEWSAKLTAN